MLKIIESGLPKTNNPKKIAIIGAGIAGLVAASLLKEAGHETVLIEADKCVGGRIKTLREPFSQGLYAEVGAMRIPSYHELTLALVKKLNLPLKIFSKESDKGLVYVKGIKIKETDYQTNPNIFDYQLKENEKNKTAEQLFNDAIQKIANNTSGKEKINGLLAEYDKLSLYSYLKNHVGYSSNCIEMIGILLNNECLMNTSLLECIRDHLDLNTHQVLYTIQGGMDNFPKSLFEKYKKAHGEILLDSAVTGIYRDATKVVISYNNNSFDHKIYADYAIVTVPFTVLRHFQMTPAFSPQKMRAIRQLNYSNSTKIFTEFRKAFWKEQNVGGSTITDLPLRSIHYPDVAQNGHAILLSSYTWGADSLKWENLDANTLENLVLDYLAKIHGKAVYQHHVVTVSYSWLQNSFTRGAFAHFEPHQQTELHQHITQPEGRIYFAGEHTSLSHGWIEGAIESAIQAGVMLNEKSRKEITQEALI